MQNRNAFRRGRDARRSKAESGQRTSGQIDGSGEERCGLGEKKTAGSITVAEQLAVEKEMRIGGRHRTGNGPVAG